MKEKTIRHTGRLPQTFIYLGKLFRMFIFQNDWKVLPMSAIIAGLVSFAVGSNLFKTMEGTLTGTFALACICIWNGFFNSIQVICRERAIIKREHRSGLHISSYILAHMIYQAFICICQVIITIVICIATNIVFPKETLLFSIPYIDFGITMFLITYCADMLALMISAIAKTTTTAMTVMPFLLIVQLVFSGGFFSLPDAAEPLTDFTIAKWGLISLCAQGNYNSLPMVTVWNSAVKMKDIEIEGQKPLKIVLQSIEEKGQREEILKQSGLQNQNPKYNFDLKIVLKCWKALLFWIVIYVAVATLFLEYIDKDKR